ncbi:hypothetical protein Tco_0524330, partial [Tanacetum coccineum]
KSPLLLALVQDPTHWSLTGPAHQPTSVVRNTLGKEQVSQNLDGSISNEALHEYCDKNYHRILPIIAEKVHQEKERRAEGRTSKKGSNLEMLVGGPEVLSSETRRRMCPHIREIQGTCHIIVAAEIQKAATKVLTPGKQKLLLRNIILKEHPRIE